MKISENQFKRITKNKIKSNFFQLVQSVFLSHHLPMNFVHLRFLQHFFLRFWLKLLLNTNNNNTLLKQEKNIRLTITKIRFVLIYCCF